MPFLFLLLALLAGAFIGWISVLGSIWFVMPIFLICAAIVSIALGREFRWRLAAFSIGMFLVLGLEARSTISEFSATQAKAKQHLEQKLRENKKKTLPSSL